MIKPLFPPLFRAKWRFTLLSALILTCKESQAAGYLDVGVFWYRYLSVRFLKVIKMKLSVLALALLLGGLVSGVSGCGSDEPTVVEVDNSVPDSGIPVDQQQSYEEAMKNAPRK